MNMPPLLLSTLLKHITPKEFRTELLGDMAEMFQTVACDKGRTAAIRWYFTQTLYSAGDLLMHSFLSANPVKIISAILLGSIAAEAGNLAMTFLKYAAFGPPANSPLTLTTAAILWAFTGAISGGFIANWMLGKRNLFVLAVIGLVALRPVLGTSSEGNTVLFSIIAVLTGLMASEFLSKSIRQKRPTI